MLHKLVIAISAVSAGLLLILLRQRLAPVPETFQSYFTPPNPDPDLFSTDPHLNSRLALAEKLFQKTVDDRKKVAQKLGYNRPFPDEYIRTYNVWDFIRPSFFCPHDLERVGALGDGGKVVCGMSRYEKEHPGPSSDDNAAEDLIVYSFGVEEDSAFEAALLERTNAKIWGYDYSVDSWAKDISANQGSRTFFKQVGISGKTDTRSSPPMATIQDLMKANGHSYVDLIKMDIEGAEFDAMTSLIEHSKAETQAQGGGNMTLPFGQLLIEIHLKDKKKSLPGLSSPRDLKAWLKWWGTLEEVGLRPVNNEENWVGDVVFGRPRFMEYTLINVADRERNKLLWAYE